MIGNKIVEARKKIHISQAELAERIFISSQAVGKWERGESMPDIVTFNRLAEILGVDLNYFSENFQSTVTEMAPIESLEEIPEELSIGKLKKKLSWDMSHWNLIDADFSGLKNLHEKFSSSNMRHCLFVGSDMSGLHLKNNNVDGCNFSGSDLSGSHIHNSHLLNNLFRDCSLKATEFSGSYVMGCDFAGANFTESVFKSGGLQNNPLSNAVWNRTSFHTMHLVDLVFEGKLEDCHFENCAFTRVTFKNAMLSNTFFKNKSLKGINFVDCKVDKLTYAFLKSGKADLKGIKGLMI